MSRLVVLLTIFVDQKHGIFHLTCYNGRSCLRGGVIKDQKHEILHLTCYSVWTCIRGEGSDKGGGGVKRYDPEMYS